MHNIRFMRKCDRSSSCEIFLVLYTNSILIFNIRVCILTLYRKHYIFNGFLNLNVNQIDIL